MSRPLHRTYCKYANDTAVHKGRRERYNQDLARVRKGEKKDPTKGRGRRRERQRGGVGNGRFREINCDAKLSWKCIFR